MFTPIGRVATVFAGTAARASAVPVTHTGPLGRSIFNGMVKNRLGTALLGTPPGRWWMRGVAQNSAGQRLIGGLRTTTRPVRQPLADAIADARWEAAMRTRVRSASFDDFSRVSRETAGDSRFWAGRR